MTTQEIIRALRRLQVETGSLACLGCGHENSCSTKGCVILRQAAETMDIPPCEWYADGTCKLRKWRDKHAEAD